MVTKKGDGHLHPLKLTEATENESEKTDYKVKAFAHQVRHPIKIVLHRTLHTEFHVFCYSVCREILNIRQKENTSSIQSWEGLKSSQEADKSKLCHGKSAHWVIAIESEWVHFSFCGYQLFSWMCRSSVHSLKTLQHSEQILVSNCPGISLRITFSCRADSLCVSVLCQRSKSVQSCMIAELPHCWVRAHSVYTLSIKLYCQQCCASS